MENGRWREEVLRTWIIIIMLGSGSYTQKCLIWKTVKQEQLLVYDCESAHLHNLNKFTHHMWNLNGLERIEFGEKGRGWVPSDKEERG